MVRFSKSVYVRDAAVCIVLILVLFISAAASLVTEDREANQYVRIVSDGKPAQVLSLSEDLSDLEIEGVRIKIQDGRAFISGSDCPDKTCTQMYGVDKRGGGAVCLPNRVALEPADAGGTHYVIG